MNALIKFLGSLAIRGGNDTNLPVQASAQATVQPATAAQAKQRRCLVRTYLDTSTSMRHLAEALATQFNAFLDQLTTKWVGSGGDPDEIYVSQHAFNASVTSVEDWTRIGKAKRWTAGTYHQYAARGTALYDAIAEGCRRIVNRVGVQRNSGRAVDGALVILTDGGENQSRTRLAQVQALVAEARSKGIPVYFCFIGSGYAQRAAMAEARGLGIDENSIFTAEATEEGMTSTFGRTTESISGTWHFPTGQ